MQSLYDRVVTFVAEQCGVSVDRLKPETTLVGKLGIAGDDGDELLEKFAREFVVEMSACNPSRYFGSEGCAPWAPIFWLIMAFRKGSAEQRAGLEPITIADLVLSAEAGRWVRG